jgi:hypothetical protein
MGTEADDEADAGDAAAADEAGPDGRLPAEEEAGATTAAARGDICRACSRGEASADSAAPGGVVAVRSGDTAGGGGISAEAAEASADTDEDTDAEAPPPPDEGSSFGFIQPAVVDSTVREGLMGAPRLAAGIPESCSAAGTCELARKLGTQAAISAKAMARTMEDGFGGLRLPACTSMVRCAGPRIGEPNASCCCCCDMG